jgi:uncharacterized low-complexity protein
MLRTHTKRSLVTGVALTFLTLALSATSASACNNPFNSAQADDSNLPMIASNETGKCSGEMASEGKPGEDMKCGESKCGDSMSTSGKPTADEKKCEGSAGKEGKEGKPSGSKMQCGDGKCGSN